MIQTLSWDVKLRIVELNIPERSGRSYPHFELPPEATEIGLGPGDTIKWEDNFDEDPPFIKGVETEEEGSHAEGYYSIWDMEPPALTFPRQFLEILKRPYSHILFEINCQKKEPHLRVYGKDHLFDRYDELDSKQNVAIDDPVIKRLVYDPADKTDEAVDLASRTPYPGQRFRIVPVDPSFEPLISEARYRKDQTRVCINSDHVASVTENQKIPSTQAEKLLITWSLGTSTPEDIDTFQTKKHRDEAKIILKDRFTEETDVVLPKKGIYKIWEVSSGRIGWNWAAFMSEELHKSGVPYGNTINSEWAANFFDSSRSDESCIILYLPVPFLKKGNPDVWWS